MEITIEWQKPLQLTQNKKPLATPDNIPAEISPYPGVYFFARWFGDSSVPFYVGQSLNIRSRLKSHLESAKIYKALLGLKIENIELGIGPRFFHYGYLKVKPGQQAKTCVKIVERQMIREAAVERGFQVLNSQGSLLENIK